MTEMLILLLRGQSQIDFRLEKELSQPPSIKNVKKLKSLKIDEKHSFFQYRLPNTPFYPTC